MLSPARPGVGGRGIRSLRTLTLGCLVLLLMLPTVTAGAQTGVDTDSASWIMPACRAELSGSMSLDMWFTAGVCTGEVNATLGIAMAEGWVCAPREVTHDQADRVVVQYIDARPTRMHEDFVNLALEALKAAWPCAGH